MSEEAITKAEEQKAPILVNGEEVNDGLVLQELQMLRERYAQEMSYEEMDERQDKIESDARENAVERVLLMQQARTEINSIRTEEIDARYQALKEEHGGDEEFGKQFELSDEDVVKIKADIEDSVRLEQYFDVLCEKAERPSEADSRSYYEAHTDEFTVPEMVHAAHIVQQPTQEIPLEKVYAELLNVRERLKNGEDFDTLAKAYFQCSEGAHDLGFFARGQMVPAFEAVAFKTKVGECSDVFQTEFGYHVLVVREYRPEMIRPYEDVRYDIEHMIFDERKNDVIGAVADKLRAGADIQNLEIVEG